MGSNRSGRKSVQIPGCLALALLLTATPLWAAPGAPGDPEPQAQNAPDRPHPDFLFGQPRGWIGLSGSLVVPRAEGDLFAFVRNRLTVEKRDFKAPALTVEGGYMLTPRFSAVAGVEVSRPRVDSEYRDFVDNNRLPINQTTKLSQVNVSGSLKVALTSRGRSISRYAFIPRTVTPYVGAGAGAFYYRLEQQGEFVDFQTFRIFADTFTSNGWTPSGHVFGGADVRLWRALFMNLDARYVWAHAKLGADFVGFDGIDLNGFRMATGVSVAFR